MYLVRALQLVTAFLPLLSHSLSLSSLFSLSLSFSLDTLTSGQLNGDGTGTQYGCQPFIGLLMGALFDSCRPNLCMGSHNLRLALDAALATVGEGRWGIGPMEPRRAPPKQQQQQHIRTNFIEVRLFYCFV